MKMKVTDLLIIILGIIFLNCNQTNSKIKKTENAFSENSDTASIIAATAMIETHMKEYKIPGMQIAVSNKGKLIWSKSFGYSDLKNKIPVTTQTSFRIASVSKSLTGAALGLLLQENKINLDSTINFYVPTFPKKRWPLTVGQIARHISGIRHYNSSEEANSSKHYNSVSESLKQFANDSLLFKPGTQFEYSSFGYILLSAVIESVSKQDFPQFMVEKVFSSLDMRHTSLDFSDKNIPYRSKFYVIDENDNRVEAPYIDNSSKWAAGGMISNAEDLVKFGSALLSGSFLHPDIVNTLFTSAKTSDGKETGSGIGWDIKKDANERNLVCMDGSLPSARSFILIYPKEQLVITILANTGNSIFFNKEEAIMVADLFLNPKGLDPTEDEQKNAIGQYSYSTYFDEDSINGKINISKINGKLSGTMTIPNRFFKDRVIPVPVIRVNGDEINIVGVPGSWIFMSYQKNKKAIHGKWRFGPLKGDLEGKQEQ
ncbi:hypothetical protein BH10BAC4_BH10BAC4_09780 [soil metagenome]